jgi:endoglycosylceramidase
LYTNRGDVLTSWGNFWKKIAESTVDSNSRNAILGYELINEPYAGDIFKHPALLVPSVADKVRLQPAYDSLASAIRSVDTEGLIFFAAVTWDDVVQAGFDHAPGGESEAFRSVFAYHYYEPPQYDEMTYFATRRKDAQKLQVRKSFKNVVILFVFQTKVNFIKMILNIVYRWDQC